MIIKDRFTIGFIAGVAGGIVMNAGDYLSSALGIVELQYKDWASVLIFGNRTDTIPEAVVALFGQLIFSGLVGIIFAYLIIGTTSKYLIFKGWVYSILVWFISYAIIVLYDVTSLIPVGIDTVLSHIVTVSLYGLVLAFVHRKLYFAAGEELQEPN